jgi:phosphatidylserine decarboxylase
MMPIYYINRETGKKEIEKVFGQKWIDFAYQNKLGFLFTDYILSQPFFSKIYGFLKSTKWSANNIQNFIKNYEIKIDEFEEKKYESFNDFFIRKFKKNARPFIEDLNSFPAPCEARYFAWNESSKNTALPVKGIQVTASKLLNDEEKAKLFLGGPILIARLCPVDYHRYHYPDDGTTVESYPIYGKLHSVNPIALEKDSKIFITNERRVSILKTKNFGYIAYIEVGALCVGKIIQTHNELYEFKRGDEKGYFLFGASTVILLFEPKSIKFDDDIIQNTNQGLETFIKLGTKIGKKI